MEQVLKKQTPKTRGGIIITQMTLYFIIYAVIGWAWETVYCSLSDGHYVARGFLYGPYCPVYGFGILLVLYLVHPYITKNTFVLFLISAFITTVLEYFTGLGLEKIFHLKLWDYSKYMLNIHGRVCLPVSIFWGVCSVIVIRYVQPKVEKAVNFLYAYFGYSLSLLIITIMTSDFIFSILKSIKNKIHF